MLNNKQFQILERQAIVAALFRICDPRGMENLKLGDTVQLKSGGPVMTLGIETIHGFKCQWFNGTELKEGLFHIDQLKKAEPQEPPDLPTSHSMRTY